MPSNTSADIYRNYRNARRRAQRTANRLADYINDNSDNLSDMSVDALSNRRAAILETLADTVAKRSNNGSNDITEARESAIKQLNNVMKYTGSSKKTSVSKTTLRRWKSYNDAVDESFNSELNRAMSPTYEGESDETILGKGGFLKAKGFMLSTQRYWQGRSVSERSNAIIQGMQNDGYDVSNMAEAYELYAKLSPQQIRRAELLSEGYSENGEIKDPELMDTDSDYDVTKDTLEMIDVHRF